MKSADIINKRFSRSFLGYDMREVDSFLDEIIEKLDTYERERTEMLTAMEYLLRELEQFDDIADDAKKLLRAAEERASASLAQPDAPVLPTERQPEPEAVSDAVEAAADRPETGELLPVNDSERSEREEA